MDAPATYLPGLLVAVVRATLAKKVLKPGGAARIAQEVEDEATGQPEDVASGSMQRRVSCLQEMARKKHDEASRLYVAGDITGGYGQRCRALGIEDAIKAVQAANVRMSEGADK